MGEVAFTILREAHDALAADLVDACGGQVVRWQGDGLVAAFSSAGQALEYASLLQPSVDRLGDGEASLDLRVGIGLGDVLNETTGDLDGPAFVDAARLCDAAEPRQVLCTDIVSRASRAYTSEDFGPTVAMTLKGLGAVEVREFLRRATPTAASGLTICVLGPLRADRAGRSLEIGGPKEQRVLSVLAAGVRQRGRHRRARRGAVAGGSAPNRGAERPGVRRAVAQVARAGARPRRTTARDRERRTGIPPCSGHWTRSTRPVSSTSRRRHASSWGQGMRCARAVRSTRRSRCGVDLRSPITSTPIAARTKPVDSKRFVSWHWRTARPRGSRWGKLPSSCPSSRRSSPSTRGGSGCGPTSCSRSTAQDDRPTRSGPTSAPRTALVDELGVEPGHELRHLEAAILEHDPALLTTSPVAGPPSRRLPAALDAGGAALVGREPNSDSSARHGTVRSRAWRVPRGGRSRRGRQDQAGRGTRGRGVRRRRDDPPRALRRRRPRP